MSRYEGVSFQQDRHRSIRRASSPREIQPARATTSSQAVENVATGSSTQFNSDVGRRTRASFRRDTVQVEQNTFQDSHLRAEQGHLQLNFNFAQNTPQHGHVAAPEPIPRPASTVMDIPRLQFLDPGQERLLPERSRSRSFGEMSDTQHSPRVPTPRNTNSSGLGGAVSDALSEANQKTIEGMQKCIDAIHSLYKTLPEKLERFNRIPGLSSMRKDLNGQSAMLLVTVEEGIGGLISAVKQTLRKSQSFQQLHPASPSSPSVQGDFAVDAIKSRLEHILHLLKQVDDLSDSLATHHDRLSLPFRQRKDVSKSSKPNQNQSTKSGTVMSRGRVGKRGTQSVYDKHKKYKNPKVVLKHFITMLTSQLKYFSQECQQLQPATHDSVLESTPIPESLEVAKKAAIMLCKALCQACPNKNHVHSILFGLSTHELPPDDDENSAHDAGVEFNLAFESQDEPETWFVVQSTMKAQDNDAMEIASGDLDDPAGEPATHFASRPSFSGSQLRAGFSSSAATDEPNARFCLQYHKQGTNDLAAALRHSDACEHELFYPDQTRLAALRDRERGAIPLDQLLLGDVEARRHHHHHHPLLLHSLELPQKVRIARLLAEAVLKFHAADWLSCEWKWDDVLLYEIDGALEPHLRFKLKGPGVVVVAGAGAAGAAVAGEEGPGVTGGSSPRAGDAPSGARHGHHPRPVGDVLSQLGTILGSIAVGPLTERPTYTAVQDSVGSMEYAEIFKACVDMSLMKPDLTDAEVREEFYAKVVARLDYLERVFSEEEEESS